MVIAMSAVCRPCRPYCFVCLVSNYFEALLEEAAVFEEASLLAALLEEAAALLEEASLLAALLEEAAALLEDAAGVETDEAALLEEAAVLEAAVLPQATIDRAITHARAITIIFFIFSHLAA